jgi:single-strand DNA-binding protein
MNISFLIGHLGHTASVKHFGATADREASVVVNFSLAVKVGYGPQAGTLWYACAWWGRRAEKCAQYMTKGSRVAVIGEPDLRLFSKRDNVPGGEIVVHVDDVELLGGPRDAGADTPEMRAATPREDPAPYENAIRPGTPGAPAAEDVPF